MLIRPRFLDQPIPIRSRTISRSSSGSTPASRPSCLILSPTTTPPQLSYGLLFSSSSRTTATPASMPFIPSSAPPPKGTPLLLSAARRSKQSATSFGSSVIRLKTAPSSTPYSSASASNSRSRWLSYPWCGLGPILLKSALSSNSKP